MLSLKEIMEQCKPGDVIGNRNWQYYVTVKISEITKESITVEGEHLASSPHTYLIKNHPNEWKTWDKR